MGPKKDVGTMGKAHKVALSNCFYITIAQSCAMLVKRLCIFTGSLFVSIVSWFTFLPLDWNIFARARVYHLDTRGSVPVMTSGQELQTEEWRELCCPVRLLGAVPQVIAMYWVPPWSATVLEAQRIRSEAATDNGGKQSLHLCR